MFSAVEEMMMLACIRNGGNQSEAYKAAHPGSKAKPKSIAVEASKFFSKPNVRLRMLELQSAVVDKAVGEAALTIEAHAEKLKELRDAALQRGQLSAAIAAEVKRGELRRFYIKQVEQGTAGEFDRMSLEELREFVYGDTAEAGTKH